MPLSGGKDSTYALYVCKKTYKIRTLAVNFDHGFQSQIARSNILEATKRLDVDLISYRPRLELMSKLYRAFFLRTGEFYTPFNLGIGVTAKHFAQKEGIPLIVYGSSHRTEERTPPEIYHCSDRYFLNVVKGVVPASEIAEYLNPTVRAPSDSRSVHSIRLPDYVEWKESKILRTLKLELSWKHPPGRYDHIDCDAEPVRTYLRQRQWGFSAVTKYSALVRDGQMTRSAALAKARNAENRAKNEPAEFEQWLQFLNIERRDVKASRDRNHMRFVPKDAFG